MPRFDLPAPVLSALRRVNEKGYEAYAVGGCVRDLLRGVTPNDYDICVSCPPQETHACFAGERIIDTGIRHGTVTVILDGMPLEITTFRTDGAYTDGRHPDAVHFTGSLTEDLARRDFTVNAMAYHPDTGVVDPFGGQEDLQNRIIRCVGDPALRFTEDALRILRALRFAAQLDFTIEENTVRALCDLRKRLHLVSRERVSAELRRAAVSPGAARALGRFPGVMLAALPDLPPSALPRGIAALGRLAPCEEELALAALLHACGPVTAEACLDSLRLPKALERDIAQLIGFARQAFSVADAPLILAQCGQAQFFRLLRLQTVCGVLSAQEAETRARRAQAVLDAGLPLSLRDLPVNGCDLMALGVSGPAVGDTLAALHWLVLQGEAPCERAALLDWARKNRTNAPSRETGGSNDGTEKADGV